MFCRYIIINMIRKLFCRLFNLNFFSNLLMIEKKKNYILLDVINYYVCKNKNIYHYEKLSLTKVFLKQYKCLYFLKLGIFNL